MLEEEMDIKVSGFIEDKIAVENVTTFYQIAKRFKLNSLVEFAFNYIERRFAMVPETQNFLHLEYNVVTKILESCNLNIHSEYEVFSAANSWLSYNVIQRTKFAKKLLLTVRLPLLSEHDINYLLINSSVFSEDNECVNILKGVLANKQNFSENRSSKYYTNRYCNQNKFNILICGGHHDKYETISDVNQIVGINFKYVKSLSSLIQKHNNLRAVCLKDNIYLFGCGRSYENMSVEKYSFSTKTWSKAADMHDQRDGFCTCAFTNYIFVNGGYYARYFNRTRHAIIDSCLQFDTRDDTWKEVARMNETRMYAACAVFQGNVIVSGGFGYNNHCWNTVESYNFISEKWTSMPNMISGKSEHSLVAVRNKLFVIGNVPQTCEVFDGSLNKFVALKLPPIVYLNEAISFGNKLLIVHNKTQCIIWYNFEKDEWSEELSKAAKRRGGFSCLKIPW